MEMSPLTRRSSHSNRPPLGVLGQMALTPARLHEFCGPARHLLALITAAATQGPVFWISPSWAADRLNPDGMAALVGPERFTFLTPKHPIELLWCLEEVLRSGAVPLAVAELPDLPGLTPVRRLHLAAETGAGTERSTPLGLILTPGDGGATGVESRWHMAPDHGPGQRRWTLSRRRARTAPPVSWHVMRRQGHFCLQPQTPC